MRILDDTQDVQARRAVQIRKVLTVFGTRPEAVKLAPVVKELERRSEFVSRVCVTAQHQEILYPFLTLFGIQPDHDLHVMQPDQSLSDVTVRVLADLRDTLEHEQPDIVLVQGDTTTAFATALAGFYSRIRIGHVEAGLRTRRRYEPYPEEINRQLISRLADLHFAPTISARDNLLAEGIRPDAVFITGNTVVDALFMILERTKGQEHLPEPRVDPKHKLILVTAHRRESLDAGLADICRGLRAIVEQARDAVIVFPVHPNPRIRSTVVRLLGGVERVHLVEPLDYLPFVRLMSRAHLILTDSGGIQEEAPSLGKPVLVLRDTTERPEALEAGAAKLVGTQTERIVYESLHLLRDPDAYARMADVQNPFGDGQAACRIVNVLQATQAE